MSVSPAGSKGSYEIQSKTGNKLGGQNLALNGTEGEVGIFFLRSLIFILSPHKCKLLSTTTASYFSFHLMAIVCVMANWLLN